MRRGRRGRRDATMADHLEPTSQARMRVVNAMSRPSLWDSVIIYLEQHGHKMPDEVTKRNVTENYVANDQVQVATREYRQFLIVIEHGQVRATRT